MQPGGGDVLQFLHIDGQGGHSVQGGFLLLLPLWRGGGVQSPRQRDGQFGCVIFFLDMQHDVLRLINGSGTAIRIRSDSSAPFFILKPLLYSISQSSQECYISLQPSWCQVLCDPPTILI